MSAQHVVPHGRIVVVLVGLIVAARAGGALLAPPAQAASNSGELLWERTWNRTSKIDSLQACCAGPGGALYVCGDTESNWTTQGDLLLIKYAANGTRSWTRTWAGPDGLADWGWRVAVDRNGNVIAAGGTTTTGSGKDWAIVKWSANGVLRWATTYNGLGGGDDLARDLELDSAGNVYVCGISPGAFGSGDDMVVAKYRAGNGTLAWEERYVGPLAGGGDGAFAIAIDSARNTYMVGFSANLSGGDDAMIVKVDADGQRVWARRTDGPTGGWNNWYDVALVGDNLYVAGDCGSDPATDLFVGKFTIGNATRWTRSYDNPGGTNDWTNGMAVNSRGDLYVAASVDTGNPMARTAEVAKWNAAGQFKWRRSFRGPTSAEYWAVTTNKRGYVWCAGYAADVASQRDALIAKYAPSGARKWLWRFDAGSLEEENVNALALSGTTALYAIGESAVPPDDQTTLVMKFRR